MEEDPIDEPGPEKDVSGLKGEEVVEGPCVRESDTQHSSWNPSFLSVSC